MSPYKNFLNATKSYLETNGFLKFLLSFHIGVFAIGGGLFVLGSFFYGAFGGLLSCLGTIIMLAGLLLMLLKEDMLILVIISGIIALGSLGAWIYKMVALGGGLYGFGLGFLSDWFSPMFYFLAFAAITLIVIFKSEKFKQMRAAAAARAPVTGAPCARCGGFVPVSAGFCPTCGAPNTPPQPQYAPPVQQYAPPAPPPQPVPVTQPEPAPEPAAQKCASCGSDVPNGAAFCARCGAKQ